MNRIIMISYTGLDAPGGVPAFNRAIHAAFPDRDCRHFCWSDHPFHPEIDASQNLPEWEKARMLNNFLIHQRLIHWSDVIIADGFWADGLQSIPKAISHSHGIWSHLTDDDVKLGKQPDMPWHHAAQVTFRQRWVELKKPLTAVSQFIADQMKKQWGFEAHVINNGVDTDLYKPMEKRSVWGEKTRPLIIHGVNDKGNINKGWDYIEQIIKLNPSWNVLSLDEACFLYSIRSDHPWKKHEVLAQADLVVHPSGYEGNSMFIAEALACGVPVVGYNVGYLYSVDKENHGPDVGYVIDRNMRDPESFARIVGSTVDLLDSGWDFSCRRYAEQDLSKHKFSNEWREYVERLEKI